MANPLDTPLTQQPSGKDGKILVIVQLSGGNDGLNTVVPYADDAYHRARPQHRATTAKRRAEDRRLRRPAPEPRAAEGALRRREMAIVQGVGYPNPNRSHFRSMDIWHSGAAGARKSSPTAGSGATSTTPAAGCDPHVGVSIGEQMPLAMKGERITPLSFDRPETYRYNGRNKEEYLR